MAALSFWRPLTEQTPRSLAPWTGRPALLIGRVVGYPVGRPNGDTFLLRVRWVQPSGAQAFRARDRVGVFRKNPKESFSWGDEISVWGPLMAVDAGRGVGGTSARIFVPEGRSHLLRRASPFHPVRWAAALRDRFHAAFNKHLPDASNHLLCGILLGDRPPGLDPFAADFRRSGTFHLLVASGSNVGFALGVWWVFSRWMLWWPRRWTIAGAPFIAFLYALMAGGDPPVLRAAVMASVGSVGALLGRWDRLEHPLILSAGILLLWNPESLFQAGFQMSYAATLAIAVVWGLERDRPGDVAPPSSTGSRFFRRAISWARELLVTSVSAQVALAPLLLYYFGRLSWVGIVANMVAVPLSGLCLTLGAGLVFLDGIWPAAASVWAVPTRWSAEGLAGWAHLCAKTPGAEWHHAINGPQAIALAIGVALGFTVLHLNKKRGVILMALTAATLVVVWGLSSPKPFFSLKLSWGGGRSPSVRVQTEQNLTVFEKGEPSPLPSLLVDGGQWVDGRTRWEVIRPEGGDGFAIRIHSGQTQTLLNFGLTAAQQAEWLRRGPIPVDLLSWASGKGGPPKEELLRVLSPRWIVYQGTRIPLSVRQFGSAVYRPGRSGLSWRTDETISGFDRGFPGN